MRCPVDDTELAMSTREGIEIDYCPKCRGVWLDRGELDKIIERTAPSEPPRKSYDDDRYKKYGHRPHKKKSLLGELFDF